MAGMQVVPLGDISNQRGPAKEVVQEWLVDEGSPARFARVFTVTFGQDVGVSVRVCLVAFPRKRPTHPDRIADVAAQAVTYRPAARRVQRAR